MTMRQGDYGRDPLQILCDRETAAERRSCKGCRHELTVFDRKVCAKSITGKHGRRCSAYAEKEIKRIEPAQ